MKTVIARVATIFRVYLLSATLAPVVLAMMGAPSQAYHLPKFRHGGSERPPPLEPGVTVRLVADENFAPFSFRTASGQAAGLAVDLALSACGELKTVCEVKLLPLDALLPSLAKGEADMVLDGPHITAPALGDQLLTRPWFRSLGRFAVQAGNPLSDSAALDPSGKRIGVVKGSAHAAWLDRYYDKASVVPFASLAEAQDALRTGAVDLLFGDDLALIYWVTGSASHGCCKLLAGAFTDYETFSRNDSFIVPKDRDDLRDAFDWALDSLQGNGTTEKLFNAYLPLSPW